MTARGFTMPEALQQFKAELFKALAHPTRIRILELLREGERSVRNLQVTLALEGSVVSQQLAILRMKNLVDTRRAGNSILYRLRDPQVNQLLDVARHMFDAHVIEMRAMAAEAAPAPPQGRRGQTATHRVTL
jgi:DNA-binding transcriptional ArsR family regulator